MRTPSTRLESMSITRERVNNAAYRAGEKVLDAMPTKLTATALQQRSEVLTRRIESKLERLDETFSSTADNLRKTRFSGEPDTKKTIALMEKYVDYISSRGDTSLQTYVGSMLKQLGDEMGRELQHSTYASANKYIVRQVAEHAIERLDSSLFLSSTDEFEARVMRLQGFELRTETLNKRVARSARYTPLAGLASPDRTETAIKSEIPGLNTLLEERSLKGAVKGRIENKDNNAIKDQIDRLLVAREVQVMCDLVVRRMKSGDAAGAIAFAKNYHVQYKKSAKEGMAERDPKNMEPYKAGAIAKINELLNPNALSMDGLELAANLGIEFNLSAKDLERFKDIASRAISQLRSDGNKGLADLLDSVFNSNIRSAQAKSTTTFEGDIVEMRKRVSVAAAHYKNYKILVEKQVKHINDGNVRLVALANVTMGDLTPLEAAVVRIKIGYINAEITGLAKQMGRKTGTYKFVEGKKNVIEDLKGIYDNSSNSTELENAILRGGSNLYLYDIDQYWFRKKLMQAKNANPGKNASAGEFSADEAVIIEPGPAES